MINTLVHHCEAVLHLRFNNDTMVTCSKVRYTTKTITIATCTCVTVSNTVDPLIVDPLIVEPLEPLNIGHNRNNLSIKDTS